jgi:hypothetical protein
MTDDWKETLQSMGLPVSDIEYVLDSWTNYAEPKKSEILYRLLLATGEDWPLTPNLLDRLNRGVYSPLQMLLYIEAKKSQKSFWEEYPFSFSLMGELISTLLTNVYRNDEVQSSPSLISHDEDSKKYHKLLQSIFYLRELREEREPLSIEVYLPLDDSQADSLEIKKFSQIFGRGIGTSRSGTLAHWKNPTGSIDRVFFTHRKAPQSLLYPLGPFQHLKDEASEPEPGLTIVLRRDGHLTIAAYQNPLAEFYDGGWHICDLLSGEYALQELLGQLFGNDCDPRLAEYMLRLAYHLGTHWHGGLLAILKDEKELNDPDGTFETETPQSKELLKQVQEKMKSPKSGKPRITEICLMDDSDMDKELSGKGRLLLSCAIQDGATLFNSHGDLLSVGRIVRTHNTSASNLGPMGSRRLAALTLADHGIALAISQDGAIRLFAKDATKGIDIMSLRLH